MDMLDDLSDALFGMNYAVYLAEIDFDCSQDLNIENKVKLAFNDKNIVISNTYGKTKIEMLRELGAPSQRGLELKPV